MSFQNAYLNSVMDDLRARYAHEPEYLQAVGEFLEPLSPVIDSDPRYEQQNIVGRMAEPEEVVDAHAWDDFEIEGDAQELLEDMMISCLVYEVRIAAASAYAAENIMRQNATSESLKKLDEMESEATRVERKKKNQAAFRKTIDSFIKQKSLRR